MLLSSLRILGFSGSVVTSDSDDDESGSDWELWDVESLVSVEALEASVEASVEPSSDESVEASVDESVEASLDELVDASVEVVVDYESWEVAVSYDAGSDDAGSEVDDSEDAGSEDSGLEVGVDCEEVGLEVLGSDSGSEVDFSGLA